MRKCPDGPFWGKTQERFAGQPYSFKVLAGFIFQCWYLIVLCMFYFIPSNSGTRQLEVSCLLVCPSLHAYSPIPHWTQPSQKTFLQMHSQLSHGCLKRTTFLLFKINIQKNMNLNMNNEKTPTYNMNIVYWTYASSKPIKRTSASCSLFSLSAEHPHDVGIFNIALVYWMRFVIMNRYKKCPIITMSQCTSNQRVSHSWIQACILLSSSTSNFVISIDDDKRSSLNARRGQGLHLLSQQAEEIQI